MPWFAWIALAGIVVYGIITVTELITGRSKNDLDSKRLAALEEKVRAIESNRASDTL